MNITKINHRLLQVLLYLISPTHEADMDASYLFGNCKANGIRKETLMGIRFPTE